MKLFISNYQWNYQIVDKLIKLFVPVMIELWLVNITQFTQQRIDQSLSSFISSCFCVYSLSNWAFSFSNSSIFYRRAACLELISNLIICTLAEYILFLSSRVYNYAFLSVYYFFFFSNYSALLASYSDFFLIAYCF